jgi:anti-sigma B factor antagonist
MAIGDESGRTYRRGQPLELQDVVGDGTHTLVLRGELDLSSAAELNRRLLPLCRDATNAVVLDLRQLTFIDASGLQIIVVAREVCARHETEFALVPGPTQVQRVFQVTGLLDVLPFQSEAGS